MMQGSKPGFENLQQEAERMPLLVSYVTWNEGSQVHLERHAVYVQAAFTGLIAQ